mgnify:FL=1
MFALMVNGGDSTCLKGVFEESRIMPLIEEVLKDTECTVENGYMFTDITSKVRHGPNEKVYSAHDAEDPEDFSILFQVIGVELNQELEIEV